MRIYLLWISSIPTCCQDRSARFAPEVYWWRTIKKVENGANIVQAAGKYSGNFWSWLCQKFIGSASIRSQGEGATKPCLAKF